MDAQHDGRVRVSELPGDHFRRRASASRADGAVHVGSNFCSEILTSSRSVRAVEVDATSVIWSTRGGGEQRRSTARPSGA